MAPKVLLAALILFLPLVVISALVVDDKNAQIGTLGDSIHGIEYVLKTRLLLEQIERARVAASHDTAIAPAGGHSDAVQALLDDIDTHLAREADQFDLRTRYHRIGESWQAYQQAVRLGDRAAAERNRKALTNSLREVFRYIGDRSGLSALPEIEAAYIARLVIRQVPEAVVRIGEVRALAASPATGGHDREHAFLFNDWSLTLAHTDLVDDFHAVTALDRAIDAHLNDSIMAFDEAAHRFHAAVIGPEATASTPPGAASVAEHVHGNGTASAADIDRLGEDAAATALALFDRATSTLQALLEARLRSVERTKNLALAIVLGTSLVAAFAGWFLLRSLTRPLEAEIAIRKRAEQRARMLASVVESSQDSILVISPDNIFTSWNRGAERLYGYRADEAIGQPTTLLAPPGLEDETPAAVADAMRNATTPTLETVRKRKDGSLVHVSLRSSPVHNEEGEVTGIAVIGRNITERKMAEASLREKERALEMHVAQLSQAQHEISAHRDHLEDKVRERTAEVQAQAEQLAEALEKEKEFNALQSKFVSMASHEFRTPLAIIDGSAQRILRRADRIEPEDLAARVNKIRSAVTRMLTLIESTLSMSRLEAGKVQLNATPCDIAALVREVCNRQQEISERHQIRFDLDALPGEIVADAKLLDQVFTNLLSNAVKYAPDSPDIDVVGKRDGLGVSIAVTDRGRGIPADELAKMFQRFYRASTSNGIAGTGIGLNLAKEFVELHGGTIDVESEVGAGTTFTVRLPLVATTHARQHDTLPAPDAMSGVAA